MVKRVQGLEDKVALVTGGASGIGRSTASAFARQGAKVVVADVDVEGGEKTVFLIKEAGGDGIFVKADVSKAAEVKDLINKAAETYGRLDCAVNSAGISGSMMPTADYPEEEWDRVINVDLKGIWLSMKYEIPRMIEGGGGAIVNISSAAGLVGTPEAPVYTAAKHGVVGLTKTAALDYAKSGIRVNVVCPGAIKTPMSDELWKGSRAEEAKHILEVLCPMGRIGEPGEVAEAAVWLCSDQASYVTGSIMTVDGGVVAQ